MLGVGTLVLWGALASLTVAYAWITASPAGKQHGRPVAPGPNR
jgi:hypothetical protein